MEPIWNYYIINVFISLIHRVYFTFVSLGLGCGVNLRWRYQLTKKAYLDLGFAFFFSSFKICIGWVEVDRLSWYDCHIVLIPNATLVHADIRLCSRRRCLWVFLQQPISNKLYHNITLSFLIDLMIFLWWYCILLRLVRILGMLISIWLWHYSRRVLGLINIDMLLCCGQWSSFGIAERRGHSWDAWYMTKQLRLCSNLVGDVLCCWLLIVSVGIYWFARHSRSLDLLLLIQNLRSCRILLRALRYMCKLW